MRPISEYYLYRLIPVRLRPWQGVLLKELKEPDYANSLPRIEHKQVFVFGEDNVC
jgi:hypothetical protein